MTSTALAAGRQLAPVIEKSITDYAEATTRLNTKRAQDIIRDKKRTVSQLKFLFTQNA